MTTTTCTTRTARRRLVAVALSLPLALTMTGTAMAAGSGAGPSANAVPAGERAPQAGDNSAHAAQKRARTPAEAPAEAPAGTRTDGPPSKSGTVPGKSAARATSSGPDSSSNPDKHGAAEDDPVLSTPQPLSRADGGGTGANPGGTVAGTCDSAANAYCSTRDGSPSGNGNGGGGAAGKPCAGCVGKADNKNPSGQAPGGSDRNAGYECDRNHGVGRTNPAHTGCTTRDLTPPPTVPPLTCPAVPVMGPVMRGCRPPGGGGGSPGGGTPPGGGGDTPIGGAPPGEAGTGAPGGGTPGTGTPGTGTPGTGTPGAGTPGGGTPTGGRPPGEAVTGPPTSGATGNSPVVGPVPRGAVPPAVVTGRTLPRASGIPGSLPFTGTDAALLAELGLLLLVVGSGLHLVARGERAARGT